MMLSDVLDVLTCSNITCPDAPLWYAMAANWAAHVGIGAFLAAFLSARFFPAVFLALIVKELAGDFARAPSLAVAGDSALDLAAMLLGARIAGVSQFARATRINALARLWPLK